MKGAVKSLLSIKEWNEEEAKARFVQAFHALAEEEEKLSRLKKEYADELLRLEGTRGVVGAGKIFIICDYLSFLVSKIDETKVEVEARREELEEAREALMEKTKEKKIYQRLLEKLSLMEKRKFLKGEQAFIDDIAGKRWNGDSVS